MNIKEYFRTESLEKAYELLQLQGSEILGGGLILNMDKADIRCMIDISARALHFIEEKDGFIEIGAMTTLRELEENSLFKEKFDGIVSKAVSGIMGVQVRNTATIGGAVWSRKGFSNLLTALSVLDTRVKLYGKGAMALEKFLSSNITREIITKILIKKDSRKACFKSVRNTSTDFSILNAAVSKVDEKFIISVGARPYMARLAYEAMDFINNHSANEESAEEAGNIASKCLDFGSDIRGSLNYRRELCRVLVKRCIMEVIN